MNKSVIFILVFVLTAVCWTFAEEPVNEKQYSEPKPSLKTPRKIDADHILFRHRIGVSWKAVTETFDGVSEAARKNIEDGQSILDSVITYPLQVFILLPVCLTIFAAGAVIGFRKIRSRETGNDGK